jgi:hypothetical protein
MQISNEDKELLRALIDASKHHIEQINIKKRYLEKTADTLKKEISLCERLIEGENNGTEISSNK